MKNKAECKRVALELKKFSGEEAEAETEEKEEGTEATEESAGGTVEKTKGRAATAPRKAGASNNALRLDGGRALGRGHHRSLRRYALAAGESGEELAERELGGGHASLALAQGRASGPGRDDARQLGVARATSATGRGSRRGVA